MEPKEIVQELMSRMGYSEMIETLRLLANDLICNSERKYDVLDETREKLAALGDENVERLFGLPAGKQVPYPMTSEEKQAIIGRPKAVYRGIDISIPVDFKGQSKRKPDWRMDQDVEAERVALANERKSEELKGGIMAITRDICGG